MCVGVACVLRRARRQLGVKYNVKSGGGGDELRCISEANVSLAAGWDRSNSLSVLAFILFSLEQNARLVWNFFQARVANYQFISLCSAFVQDVLF